MQTYFQQQHFSDELNGRALKYLSKPGIPQWDQITPSARLLAEQINFDQPVRMLVYGCGHGAMAAALSRKNSGGELWIMDTLSLALDLSLQTFQANDLPAPRKFSVLQASAESRGFCDTIVIDLPKGRQLAQRWIAEAFALLQTGGQLFLAGANKQGIRSVIKDAESLFGNSTILAYKKGNRIARFEKPARPPASPDWLESPGIRPGSWIEFEAGLPGETLRLRSLPGVFSANQLDEGTRLLLQSLEIPAGSRVLDLGCGCGVIGLHAARSEAAQVDMIDNNLYAVAAAQENIRLHGLQNARAFPSDALEAVQDQNYDLVVSNPPFHSGKEVDYQITQAFIQQASQVLVPGGEFWLVANQFIRYEATLQSFFQRFERVAENSRYYVIRAVTKPEPKSRPSRSRSA